MSLKIHFSQRYLIRDGAPFFYLADTAWEMLHRLDIEETEFFLRDRASKGFTAIQVVILAEENGLRTPNRNGDLPLQNLDPMRPNPAYFTHIERVLEIAAELDLVFALLPTWGDKWNLAWGQGPEVFTPENARIYGEFLAHRFAEFDNIIWVLGGDRPFENQTHREIIEAMAEGLGDAKLRTFHPCAARGSSQDFPDAAWLDFHMWQSGHGRNTPNYEGIASDYARTPVKPTLDGEPGYEDHKAGFAIENGFLDDYDNRKALYWALFAGACGHTYGCHAVWQFFEAGRKPVNHPRREWREAIQLPGAAQMGFARVLHDRFPFVGETPAPEIVICQPENKASHIGVLREKSGAWALVYFPSDVVAELDLSGLRGESGRASWFNPRNGEFCDAGQWEKTTRAFPIPGWGPDWILVLESEGAENGQ